MSGPTYQSLEGLDALGGDVPFAIRSITDALELASALFDLVPPCACAVRLDDDGHFLDVVRVDGDPTDVDAVADVVLVDGLDRDEVAAVFLLSVGAEVAPGTVDADLVDEWFRLDDLFDDAGIELVDWLLVGPQHVRSMARATGVGWRW